MKKYFLYSILTFGLFFVFNYSASAKVNVDYDLRNYESEFMIFYELKESTPLANYLISHGSGKTFINQVLSETGASDYRGYDYYSVWISYADVSRESGYVFNVHLYDSSHNYNLNIDLYYDLDMHYINNSQYVYQFSNYNFKGDTQLDFKSHPSYYFNYYTGNIDYYDQSDTFVLHKIIDLNGEEYLIQSSLIDDVLGFFGSFFGSGELYGYNNYAKYFIDNAIIGKNVPLVSLSSKVFNNVEDSLSIDLNVYNSVNISDYSNGVVLIPQSSDLTNVTNNGFLAYSLNGAYLNGRLIRLNDDSIEYLDNYFRSNFNGYSTIQRFNFQSFSGVSSLPENLQGTLFYNFAYYFFTDNTRDDVVLYYDKFAFDLVDLNSDNRTVDLFNFKNGSFTSVDLSDLKDTTRSSLSENHYVYNGSRDINGIPVVCDLNDNCVSSNDSGLLFENSNLGDKTSAISLINETKEGISVMSFFFTSIFEGFPFLLNLLKFVFSAVVIIAVIKLITG